MTYIIKRGNRRYNNKTYETYESARNYARKVVRRETNTRNPILSQLGFSIVLKEIA